MCRERCGLLDNCSGEHSPFLRRRHLFLHEHLADLCLEGLLCHTGIFVSHCTSDLVCELDFLLTSFVDELLDSIGSDKSNDFDVTLLTKAMGSVLGLDVILRVIRLVKDDDFVGSREVDTCATCSGCEQEHWNIRVVIELVNQRLSLHNMGAPHQDSMLNIQLSEHFLQQLNDARKLAEYKDSVTVLLILVDELEKFLHLSAVHLS